MMTKYSQKFWKPGSDSSGQKLQQERSDPGTDSNNSFVFNTNVSLSLQQQRQKLPVFYHKLDILHMVEKYQTVIIIGETGSGKSTQLPQYLLEAGWGADNHVILVTQPRRIAAVTVATRVAEERGAVLGHEVGYVIRFDGLYDEHATRIKFMTDGLLIREMMQDPLLTKYSVVMLDEAHERSLNTDIVIGLIKKIQKKRQDLRVIIASATLDAEKFFNFFNTNETKDPSKDTAAILTVEGRMYPVDIHYTLNPIPDYLKATVETIMKIHRSEKPGNILAFLTGMDEVEHVVQLLVEESKRLPIDSTLKMMVLPMHGSLPASEQLKVFQHSPKIARKIVISTNIAEASVTIPGIVYVIDCGFVKLPAFSPKTGTDCLVVVPVSKASAEQRAGRGGRVRSGKVYRLYTEDDFLKLPESTVPEMQRSNMAGVILQLKALGIENVLRFDFLSAPPAENMLKGLEILLALGAINDASYLTDPLGLQMAEFPLHPMYAKMLLVSGDFECSEEILTITSMVQINNVFVTPQKQKIEAGKSRRMFAVEEGDHVTLLNVYQAFMKFKQNSRWCHQHFLNYKGLCRAVNIRNQLKKILVGFKVPLVSSGDDSEKVLRCVTSGFFPNAAKYHYTGTYRTLREDHPLHIHPTSVLYAEKKPQWIVYNEVVQTNKEYMRDITVINPEWLYTLAPHYYQYGTEGEIAAKRAKTGQYDD